MDISSMLNDGEGGQNHRHSSTPRARGSNPTTSFAPAVPPAVDNHGRHQQYPSYSASQYPDHSSPQPPPLRLGSGVDGRYSQSPITTTNNGPSASLLVSPYAQYPPQPLYAQPSLSHPRPPSISHTPSSQQSYNPHFQQTTPTSTRSGPFQPPAHSPRQSSHTPGIRGPPSLQHSHSSLNEQTSSPYPPDLRRHSSNTSRSARPEQRPSIRREKSESVSPRTVLQDLPIRDTVIMETDRIDQTMNELPPSDVMPYSQHNSIDSTHTPRPGSMVSTSSPLIPKKRSLPAERSIPTKQIRRGIPIWAQKAKHVAPFHSKRPLPSSVNAVAAGTPGISKTASSIAPAFAAAANPSPALAPALPVVTFSGPLDPWEPTFTNVIPHEDLTRCIADFLFLHVVSNETIGTGGAGDIPQSNGQLEIEAKIGKLIDKRTHDRLRLPVSTEVLIDDGVDVAFESTMTEEQHALFNKLLNDAVQQSRAGGQAGRPRVPMEYKHTREVDTFYELPPAEVAALPPDIRGIVTRQGGTKTVRVRVTRDRKSGEVLAKIIKARIRDLHVYSPRHEFDWRVSVNVELNWDGDLQSLLQTSSADHARNKDRVSYRHLCYQIDLTQVKATNVGAQLTHELEVELSSTEVRRQGKLAQTGQANHYLELIKGFADNVRVLARLQVGG